MLRSGHILCSGLWNLYLAFCVISYVAAHKKRTPGSPLSPELEAALKHGKVKIEMIEDTVRSLEITPQHSEDEILHIFCYETSRKPSLRDIWQSAYFHISPKLNVDYQLYVGNNESDVYQKYTEANKASWLNLMGLLPSTWQPVQDVTVSPFRKTCIGAPIDVPFVVQFRISNINYALMFRLLVGLVLFYGARRLCQNIVFYYSTGISLGMVASALIVVYILSRFMPKKTSAGALLVGGWSLALYLLQYVWENVQVLMKEYKLYVIVYLTLTALVSFAVLYYRGPIKNPRALNLIQWTLQGIGLALIYSGTQIPEVSATLVTALLLFQKVPFYTFRKVKRFWQLKFPPKIKLLTEEEYARQGLTETRRALEELRQYCRSPDCNTWKTLSRLQSPSRFVDFVEGSSHLSDNEVEEHFANPNPSLSLDDEEAMDLI